MELPDFHLPHAEKIEWMIETDGFAVEPVPPDPTSDPPQAGYTYTIGFPDHAGFPDLVLVKDRRIIFAELKSRDGKPSRDQAKWLQALAATGRVEVYLWRPADLLDGTIQQHLAQRG